MSPDSSNAPLNKELREPQQAGQGQRHSRRGKVSDPGAPVVDAMADSTVREYSLHDLQDGVDGHKHVAGPVHEAAQRNPNGVRVVPGRLRCECFEAAQQARNHQAHQTRPGNVLMGITARVPDDGNREE